MDSALRGFTWRVLLGTIALLIGSAQHLPAQVAKGRTLTGYGSLESSDGARRGQWRAEFVVDAGGALRGNFRFDGIGGGEPAVAAGSADDRQLSFSVVTGADRGTVYQFEGEVLGTGVEGTFSGSQGLSGTWQGFCDEVGGPKPPVPVEPGPIVISN